MIEQQYKDDIELMERLEGLKFVAYDCSLGFRTVGYGFNMEQVGARKTWNKLNIQENFDLVFDKQLPISQETADLLFMKVWKWCVNTASARCEELGINYGSLPEYKKFVLADIAYNTGSVRKWKKVFLMNNPRDVIYEARRNPKEIMDSRVAKIAYYYDIIKTLDEAHELGLEFAKYIV